MKKSLYVKLVVFFFLIITIGSVVYLIITDSVAKSKNITLMINKIAYERLLAEKISKKTIEYILLHDLRDKNEIESLMDEYEDRFNKVREEMLQTKFITASDDIKMNLDHVEQHWHLFKEDINHFLSGREATSLAIRHLENKGNDLIVYLNKIIYLLEQEDQKFLHGYQLESILSLSFNIILILIIIVIWRLLVNLSINEKNIAFFFKNLH